MGIFSLFRQSTRVAETSSHRLSPSDFIARREKDAIVLDVRTAPEYQAGHVKGARNLDVSAPDFRQQAEKLDRNRAYYLYCRSGSRSEHATGILRSLGFSHACNIGSLSELSRAGVEIER